MKSKLTRMKPEELDSIKFKELKTILKKDIATLKTLGAEGCKFYVITDFTYSDQASKPLPLLVISEATNDWL